MMTRVDPRADPLTNPPKEGTASEYSVERLNLHGALAVAPRAPVALRDTTEDGPPSVSAVTSSDPRSERIEKLLDVNDWRGVADELGTIDDAGKLPPNLGLVVALAHQELAGDGNPDAAAIAIRCMAALLGVGETSPLARVLGRRLLRKKPVRLRDRPAPPARVSLMIVALTLAFGSGIGWLASSGSLRAVAHAVGL